MTKIIKSSNPQSTLQTGKADAVRAYIRAGVAEQKAMPRLIFGLDATASRQPTWDLASKLQAEMFAEVATIGGLNMQLIYFRGVDECRASRWITSGPALTELMTKIICRSGITQITRILQHVSNQSYAIRALVYVGDCFEEDLDKLTPLAATLGEKGIPAFMFQEGDDEDAMVAFKRIAELTGGVWARFDAGSASELGRLLRAAARYAAAPNKSEALTELRNVAGLLGKGG
jgi:hypothetical protein